MAGGPALRVLIPRRGRVSGVKGSFAASMRWLEVLVTLVGVGRDVGV